MSAGFLARTLRHACPGAGALATAAWLLLPGAAAHADEAPTEDAASEDAATEADATEATPTREDAASARETADAADASPRILSAPTRTGASGLNRMPTAGGITPGQVTFGTHASWMRGSDVVRRGDETRMLTGHFTLTTQPTDFLELYGGLSSRSVSNTFSNPNLIQSVGNLGIGARTSFAVVPGLHVGGGLGLQFPAGPNRVGLALDSTVADLLALASAELDELADLGFPLRVHLATGAILDGSRNLFAVELTRPERFGQDITGYSRWRFGLGVDAPLPWVTPYAEWVLDIPLNPPCNNLFTIRCIQDDGFSAFPSLITLGLRGTPGIDGVALHAGVELGLTTSESQGTPAIPAWTAAFGATWAFQAFGEAPRAAAPAPPAEPAPAATAAIAGVIADSITDAPLADVRIQVVDQPFSALVSDGDGRFRSPELALGETVALTLTREGYRTQTLEVTPVADAEPLAIALEEDIDGARFSGLVVLEEPVDEPVELFFQRPGALVAITVGEDGHFEVDLETGVYLLYVVADEHRSIRQRLNLEAGRNTATLELALATPGEPQLRPDRLVFADPIDEVAFDGEAIAAGAEVALGMVAEMIAEHPGLRLIIRTHTDDRGDAEAELALTEARAAAVLQALLGAGVDPGRLRTEAAGAREPRFPNTTDRNRSRNNRVEFAVVQP